MRIPWWWRGGSVVISWGDYMWPGVSLEQYCYPSGVQRGVTLWGEPRPLSIFIGSGDINFPWHADMIANLLLRYSKGNKARDRNLSGLSYYEVSLKQDSSFLSLGIRSLIQTAARAVSTYTQSLWTGTYYHGSSESLYLNTFGLRFSGRRWNYIKWLAKWFIFYI